MRPEVVIFDMDDVLCRYDLGKRLRTLSLMTGKMPRDIRAAVWDSGFEDQADAGGYPDPDHYLAEFGQRIGHPLPRSGWIAARREAMQPWPEMLDLARRIGEQARIAIYTNNGPLTKAAMGELFPAAAKVFPELYFSYEFRSKKPDPESFRRLLKHMDADPARCFFIDDKRSNVAGARLAGIRSHHFRHYDGLRREMAEMGFEA